MLDGEAVLDAQGGVYLIDVKNKTIEYSSECTVSYFTGIFDINSAPIYENNIISYSEKMHEHGDVQTLTGKVVFDNARGAFGISFIDDSTQIWNYFTDSTVFNFKIVG